MDFKLPEDSVPKPKPFAKGHMIRWHPTLRCAVLPPKWKKSRREEVKHR